MSAIDKRAFVTAKSAGPGQRISCLYCDERFEVQRLRGHRLFLHADEEAVDPDRFEGGFLSSKRALGRPGLRRSTDPSTRVIGVLLADWRKIGRDTQGKERIISLPIWTVIPVLFAS